MCKSRTTRTVCVQGTLDVCELLCNSGCYIVTIYPFSGLSENPTRVGHYLGWARGFPRKNLVFIFANIYFLPIQERSI